MLSRKEIGNHKNQNFWSFQTSSKGRVPKDHKVKALVTNSLPHKLKAVIGVVLSSLVLTGCNSINVPDQVKPKTDLVDTIKTQSELFDDAFDDKAPVVPDWWSSFGDPVLVDLVERSLVRNRSLDAARFNLEAEDAALIRAQLNRSFSTSSGLGFDLENRNGAAQVNTNLSANVGASWEPDLFGRIDAQIRAQTFNREAALQAQRDIAVAVAAQTAQAYVDLRGAQKRLDVAERSATLQAESLNLLQELADAGRANDLDLSRAESLYRTTLALLPTFKAQIEAAQARLSALSVSRDELPEIASERASHPVPTPDKQIAIGSVEALIRRRPDIRLAESRIAESLALGDLERSRLFPRITIGMGINSFFGTFGNGAQINNINTTFGPAISWEGPDLRGVRADIAVTDAQSRAAIATYEQTVLNALADVESSLSLYRRQLERRENLMGAEQAAEGALRLAGLRFEEGLDDFLDVLDAQRTLLNTRDDRVQNDISIATAAISSYRALGGMWTDAELQALAASTGPEDFKP